MIVTLHTCAPLPSKIDGPGSAISRALLLLSLLELACATPTCILLQPLDDRSYAELDGELAKLSPQGRDATLVTWAGESGEHRAKGNLVLDRTQSLVAEKAVPTSALRRIDLRERNPRPFSYALPGMLIGAAEGPLLGLTIHATSDSGNSTKADVIGWTVISVLALGTVCAFIGMDNFDTIEVFKFEPASFSSAPAGW